MGGVRRRAPAELAWLDLIADLLTERTDGWPAERVALQLTETYRASGCAWHGDPAVDRWLFGIWPAERFSRRLEEIREWNEHAPTSHPVLCHYMATGEVRAMQVADVPRRSADARVWADWDEFSRDWTDARHQIVIPLCGAGGGNRSLVIGRADRFSHAELAVARALRRVLTGFDRQFDTFGAWSVRAETVGHETAAQLRLTPRELAVLHLLGEALTAMAIARRLAVSQGTVHKHLERIYTKLGVNDRLSAVLRAQRVGLLPAPSVARPAPAR